ncbi:MAG: HK97 family phage prohead protease [Candidatus Omnitrophica bacterium]|nr:HK97 family phage prohead protease [Candidatus Omnitrophota bacterium]
MNKQMERRIFNLSELKVEKRGDSNQPIISGHAAVFDVLTDMWYYREKIAVGAFNKTLKTSDVRALFNHDSNWILGRNTSKTLSLSEDDTGLAVEISPPDTQLIRDMVMTPMERGDLNQMSFAFMVIDEEWEEKKGELPIRTIKEVDPLYDVSVVTFPAYPTTDAKVRDIITKSGINYDELSGLIFRAKQGLPMQRQDLDLINASIEVLKGYIPAPPDGTNGGKGEENGAGRLLILRKRLELIEKSF